MRTILGLVFSLFAFAAAPAQTTYEAQINAWTNPTVGTVAVYRCTVTSSQTCAAPTSTATAAAFTELTNTAPQTGPYTDSTVQGGTTYVYFLVAIRASDGAWSAPSSTWQAVIPTMVSPPVYSTTPGTVITISVTAKP